MFSVLYVDDEIHLLDLGKHFLEKTGDFHVTTAETVDDGLSRLEHNHFDAVISDYQMPDKDGLVFLKEVRSRFGDLPFILFTGKSREIVVIEAINNGADFYVQKGGAPTPQFAELSHKLLQVIRRKQAEDELFSSRQMLRLVLDTIPEAVFWKDRNSVFLGANRTFATDTGYADDPAGLVGKTDLETSSAEIAEFFRADDRSVMETGIPKLDYEEPQIKPDGSHAWLRTSKVPLRNREGDVIGVLGTYEDITEQKTLEDAHRESEERLRAFFDNMHEAAIISDEEGQIVEWNPAAERISGIPALRARGMYYWDLIMEMMVPEHRTPERRSQIIEMIREGLRTGRMSLSEPREIEAMKVDGSRIQTRQMVFPIPTKKGFRFGSLSEDITERKRAEEAVRQEKDFTQMSLDSLPGVFYIYDQQGRFLRWNKNLERITGYSGEEILHMHALDFFADKAVVLERMQEAFRSGEAMVEAHVITKDQKQIPMLLTAKRVVLDGNEYLIGMGIDITVRRKAEEELRAAYEQITASEEKLSNQYTDLARSERQIRESEVRFRNLIEASPVPIVLVREGRFIFTNSAFCSMTGFDCPDDVLGKPMLDFVAPEFRERVNGYMMARSRGEPVESHYESIGLRRDGSRFPYEVTVAVISLHEGPVTMAFITDITERKRAEDALRTSEATYREIFNVANDTIWIHDAETLEIIDVNNNVMEMFGYTVREGLDLTVEEMSSGVPPFIKETVTELLRKAAGGDPQVFDWHCKHKDGHLFWSEVKLKRATIAGRDCIIAVERDITERKQAEETVAMSSARLLRAELVAGLGHWEFDMETKTVYASDGARTLYGMSGQTRTLTEVQNVTFPEYRPVLDAALRALIEENKPYDVTYRIQRPSDGKILDIHSIAEYDPNTRIVFGVIQDVTEQNKMQALRESEERFRALVEHSLDGIFIVDLQGTVLFANNAIARTLEHEDCAGLLGRNVMEFVAPESHNDAMKDFEEVARGHDAYLARYKVITAKGNEIFVESIGKVISYKGKPADLLSIRDITERRLAEEALRQANRKLNLLSGVTRHDIKNQLLALSGFLDLSHKSLEDPIRTREFIEKEKIIAQTISRQISFTKDYENLGVKSPAWQNVSALVRQITPGLPMRGIRIDCADPTLEILADPLLEKVFYNLIDNALRYGGEKMTIIRIFSCKPGEAQVIVVEDDGEGISGDDKVLLFERGFGKNTGLGLFFSREILSITGITIAETGEPGKGARFEMLVPERMWRTT
jgi:PAS domain S-box-containing protein